MVKFNARLNNSNPKLVKDLEEAITQSVYDLADQIFAVSQEKAPIDLGTLRKSGVVSYGPGPRARIDYTAAHALPVHEGSKPHMPPVEPLEQWAKRHGMEPGTGWAIAKKIAREGTKKNPFLKQALDEVAHTFPEIFRDRIKVTLKR